MNLLTTWFAIAALAVTAGEISAQTTSTNASLQDWENPLVFGINKLPPRCPAWPCPDAASGWKSTYDYSPWVQSLDGDWSFHWSPDPNSRPSNFFTTDFNASDWKQIPVPSCWELQGYGVPEYVNYTYPFKVHPPYVMDEPPKNYTSYLQRNPIGSYRKIFEMPADWKGGRTLIHFAGVSSAMYLWERPESWLQRRLARPGRIRSHRFHQARQKSAGGRGL